MRYFFLAFCLCGFLSAAENELNVAQINTAMNTHGPELADGTANIINPHLYLSAAIFLGKTAVNGSEYAQKQSDATTASGGTKSSYDHINQTFRWRPGVTAGIGTHIGEDQWDLYLNFLYFRAAQGSEVAAGGGNYLVVSRANPSVPGNNASAAAYANRATSQFLNELFRTYLRIGKSFYVSNKTMLKPHFGIAYARLLEKQTIQYYSLQSSQTSAVDASQIYVKNQSKFHGLAPRIGLLTKLDLAYGFNLFAEPTFSLYAGSFKVLMKQRYSSNGNEYLDTSSFNRIVPEMDGKVGIGYGRFIFDHKQYLQLSLGYEIQYWWNQFIRYNLTNTLNELQSDMSIQSYFLEVQWMF